MIDKERECVCVCVCVCMYKRKLNLPRPFGQYSSLLHNLPPSNKQWEFPPPHVFAKVALCTTLHPFILFETEDDDAYAIFVLSITIKIMMNNNKYNSL